MTISAMAASSSGNLLTPHWPDCPSFVGACYSRRQGGVSQAPFDSFNLALHVGDNPAAVQRNRRLLTRLAGLEQAPCWLEQCHSNRVVCLKQPPQVPPRADAAVTTQTGCVLAIMTADCLPILLAHRQRPLIAAIHAGWRGLASGIISRTLAAMQAETAEITAWLGPCISQRHFAVADDAWQQLAAVAPPTAAQWRHQRWWVDLRAVAAWQLRQAGVQSVAQSADCTYTQVQDYFSYRRQGACGRMAALIWLKDQEK